MNLMTTTMAALYVALALPVQAQTAQTAQTTAAEQLQRGIFAQESSGKTDEAISIYRDLANSPLTPRDIAAQAQYRLIQALLQKGEITPATREMERLEREFQEYRTLISSLASQKDARRVVSIASTAGAQVPAVETAGPVSITGTIKQVVWQNPVTYVRVGALGTDYTIRLESPNVLLQRGLTRNTFKLGDTIAVQGLAAKDDPSTIQANTVTAADGTVVFDRSQPGQK
jgi:hypothetical protein